MRQTQLLKLDAPYQVILAGGYVGDHIATLVTWTEDKDGELLETESYPVLDMGEEYPAGKMVPVDVEDARVLCPKDRKTNLYWVASIIEYDFQQIEPAGADYILQRMKLLGCKIVMPTEKDEDGEERHIFDFTASMDVMCLKGIGDEPGSIYRVRGNRFDGFYFEAQGTTKEIYHDLSYQLSTYLSHFQNEVFTIKFQFNDGVMRNVENRLNAEQHIEGYEYDEYDDKF